VTDERGVATAVVLFPLFAAAVFMFVNGAMWQLDREVASAAADRASQAVALHGSSAGAAQSVAVAQMQAAGMQNVAVSISRGAEVTTVSVSGRSPGLLSGMTVTVSATSVTPTEGLRAP
jgi:Flp pilus assembly protein TadG